MPINPTILKNVFSDLPMFLTKNSFTNDINLRKDLGCIRDSIKNIILTNTGERSFDFEFGGNIYALLFENLDKFQLSGYRISIANKINRYEPRVDVTQVHINYGIKDINIVIEYSVISLNTKDKITINLERSR
jgi:phage baseplate assembly protein W